MAFFIRLLFGAVVAVLLGGCYKGKVEPPWESGELVVLTRNSPTTYYYDAGGRTAGFEHDLAVRFAEANGWRVRFEVEDDLARMFKRLKQGEAHLAAAGLTVTEGRLSRIRFGPAYAKEKELIVCGQTAAAVRKAGDLKGLRVEVVDGSSHVEHLKKLRKKVRGLSWTKVKSPSEEELLERVSTGLADCAVADNTTYQVARNFHPGLRVAFELGKEQDIAWAFPKGGDGRMAAALDAFFKEGAKGDEIGRLRERYFGHVERLEEADVLGILTRRSSDLEELKEFFLRAQSESGLDWRLLAAVAYQESHWNAKAVSRTGVRGIMMLTADTADHLGVKDRLDPEESILGGARYLRMLKDALAESIPEPDRTWLALAAYNMGMGHVDDARRLAKRLGRNPDAWNEMKDVLPLLTRRVYSSTLRYGYARGGEALHFTESVRIYCDILTRFEEPYQDGEPS